MFKKVLFLSLFALSLNVVASDNEQNRQRAIPTELKDASTQTDAKKQPTEIDLKKLGVVVGLLVGGACLIDYTYPKGDGIAKFLAGFALMTAAAKMAKN